MTRTAIVIQARMRSSRLPGKVLADLGGRPMLAEQLHRLKECPGVDEIAIATTENAADEPIGDLASQYKVRCFRGSEADVLGRFVGAAREAHAELVVRITADCPLIDPQVLTRVVNEALLHRESCDYVSNVLRRTFPRGLDVEALNWDVLLQLDRMAVSADAREHVTTFIRSEAPHLFACRSVEDDADNSDLRWTVDTPEDLQFVRVLYERLGLRDRIVPYREMITFVRAHPDILRLNSAIRTWEPRDRIP